MKLKIQLYATLDKYSPTGRSEFELDAAEGATPADVIDRLGIPEAVNRVVLVNGRYSTEQTVLTEGQTLTLFPPMEGG